MRRLLRTIRMFRHWSKVPTCITPLKRIRKAALVLFENDEDLMPVMDGAREFFSSRGISLKIFIIRKASQGFFGRPARISDNDDLFISLVPGRCFEAEFAARCSRACFKIGRVNVDSGLYDILVDSIGNSQGQTFETVKDLLVKIK